MRRKIYIGSDHAGFEVKKVIKKILKEKNFIFEDLGTKSKESVDYPDFAKKVAKKVLNDKKSFGILICGTGAGMQISANKINGIRAVFCYDKYSAEMARRDNDANILTLRARKFRSKKYEEIVETFLITEYSNFPRQRRRIGKIKEIEMENCDWFLTLILTNGFWKSIERVKTQIKSKFNELQIFQKK